jgi:hypothetical protein
MMINPSKRRGITPEETSTEARGNISVLKIMRGLVMIGEQMNGEQRKRDPRKQDPQIETGIGETLPRQLPESVVRPQTAEMVEAGHTEYRNV